MKRLTPSNIALIYIVTAILWIYSSGFILIHTFDDPDVIKLIELVKGTIFVFITGSLLYILLKVREPATPLDQRTVIKQQAYLTGKWKWLPVIIILILIMPVLDITIFNFHGPQLEKNAFEDLEDIAKLKQGQIERWLQERNGDSSVLRNDTDYANHIAEYFQNTNDSELFDIIQTEMQNLMNAYDYDSILLLDNEDKLVTSIGDNEDITPEIQILTENILNDRKVRHTDIYKNNTGEIYLDWVVPLVTSDSFGKRVIAFIVLRTMPDNFLYPLIQAWPTNSDTAETLLVRKEMDSVVFLNELRHRKNSALRFEKPLINSVLPAAIAIKSGIAGNIKSRDYRGARVLASYRPIKYADWYIVAKIDRAEVLAPIKTLIIWIDLIIFIAVIALSAALFMLWQKQKQIQKLTLLAMESETDYLLRHFYNLPFIGIAMTSPGTRKWIKVNDQLCNILGYTREELYEKTWSELTHPDDLEKDDYMIKRILQGTQDSYITEKRYIRKDGTVIFAKTDVKAIRKTDGTVEYFISTIDDITERKRIEDIQKDTLRRLQIQLFTVGIVAETEALLSGDVKQVAKQITELATTVMGAERANVWLFNKDESELHCIDLYEATPDSHSSGMILKEQEYYNEIQALKASRYVASDDPYSDPRTAGYTESYLKPFQITSMLDTLIHVSGKNFGLLCIEHVNLSHHWEQDEIVFANQLADKIGIAIVSNRRRETEDKLKLANNVVENSNVMIFRWKADNGWPVEYVSENINKFGYVAQEMIAGKIVYADIIHPDDLQRIRDEVLQYSNTSVEQFTQEYRIITGKGEVRWVEDRTIIDRDNDGNITHYQGVVTDITDRKQADDRLRRLNRLYKVISSINTLIVHVRDRDELFKEACRIAVDDGEFMLAWVGLINKDSKQVKPVVFSGINDGYLEELNITLDENDPRGNGPTAKAIRENSPSICNDIATAPAMEYWRDRALSHGFASSVALPLSVSGEPVGIFNLYAREKHFFDDKEMTLLNELAGDISFALQNIEQREKLDYLSSFDPLTGLANRMLFSEHLDYVLSQAKQSGSIVVLLVANLKQFRHVNTTYGQSAGDIVLQEVARRLRKLSNDPAGVGRITGDYFAFILPDIRDSNEIVKFIDTKFKTELNKPFWVSDTEIHIDFMTGITVFPDDGDNAETLYRNAEAAMKKAKSSDNLYYFYQPDMTLHVAESMRLENKLRIALSDNQFLLHYQPKINTNTGKITGFEALIRWNDPEIGMVQPDKFISLLEESGLIINVGKWAMHQALSDASAWKTFTINPILISVNVSSIQLQQKDFVDIVNDTVHKHVNKNYRLELEVTESLLMENIEDNIAKLTAIGNLDVNIAIDDFGTGYSSLSYLAKLPVNALKIDRSFITSMDKYPESMTIVSAIMSLAHSLNLKVIAEGVETEDQAKLLRLLKCDEMQGYLFSKPLPPENIPDLLKKYH